MEGSMAVDSNAVEEVLRSDVRVQAGGGSSGNGRL